MIGSEPMNLIQTLLQDMHKLETNLEPSYA